jgi:LysR family hydrogen peroxide-inducible transcriptional activator
MKLRQLEYLIAIADSRSFARAAAVLNVSQPTLSQQIRALETTLGLTLIERSGSGALPTPAGRVVVERARAILTDIRELAQAARHAADVGLGTIRLGTTPTLGPYLLSPVIAELHRELPDLRIHIREGIPSQQAADLSTGQIDLYLGPLPIADALLEVEPLFREPMRLAVAGDHALASKKTVMPSDLFALPILSIDQRHHYHRQVSQIADEYGMRVAADYEGTSLDTLHQMAASGLGAALLPDLYLASDAGGSAGLAILDVEGWRAYRSIGLAWRRSSTTGDLYRRVGTVVLDVARRSMGCRDG